LGHKNLALLYAGEEITISRDFKTGVISTCLENGIKLSQKNIIDIGFDSKKAAKAVDSFLQAAPEDRVSAIITLDDEIAATVIQQINAKGLKVPQDISVTGCNNIPLASLITPALTTLTVPIKELGRQAAGVLLRRLKEGPQEFKGIKLEPEITIRESTGKQKVINSNM
jgi:DNA-binding LacI/PurR family transcriptional regulator